MYITQNQQYTYLSSANVSSLDLRRRFDGSRRNSGWQVSISGTLGDGDRDLSLLVLLL